MTVQKYRLELVKESKGTYDTKVSVPSDVVDVLNNVFKLNMQCEEVFVILCMDTKNKIVGAFEVSRGTINSSIVHPREVFKRAMMCNAASIIAGHNHPSGIVTPSEEDKNITKRLVEAGVMLGMPVIDHLIVGEDSYYSFKEDGKL